MAITNGYATLAEVKASLRITDNLDDTLLETAIESASRLIDAYTSRYFYNGGTATKIFAAQDDWVTHIEDAQSITEVATKFQSTDTPTVWNIIGYVLEGGRLALPPVSELPGLKPSDKLDAYISLMNQCWAQEPSARPDFDTIASELRKLQSV